MKRKYPDYDIPIDIERSPLRVPGIVVPAHVSDSTLFELGNLSVFLH